MNVNRSSYYKHFSGIISKRELENQALRTKILQLYNASDKRLGVKKMRQRLKAEYGISISVGRVYRLMKSMQLPKMSTHRNIRRAENFNSNKNAENIEAVFTNVIIMCEYVIISPLKLMKIHLFHSLCLIVCNH